MRLVLSLYNNAINGNLAAFREIVKLVEENEDTNNNHEQKTLEEKRKLYCNS